MLRWVQVCFCYIPLNLTENLFQNRYVFYSFKKLHVSNFAILMEENDSSLQ